MAADALQAVDVCMTCRKCETCVRSLIDDFVREAGWLSD